MGSSISEDVNKIKESYSKIQDTIEYKKLRVQAIKDWPNNKRFEVENQFLERVENYQVGSHLSLSHLII
jgi:hypothetical protein